MTYCVLNTFQQAVCASLGSFEITLNGAEYVVQMLDVIIDVYHDVVYID